MCLCSGTGCWGKCLGTEREETAGDWRKELNAELQDLYSSPNIIRLIKENEMGGAYSTYRTENKCI